MICMANVKKIILLINNRLFLGEIIKKLRRRNNKLFTLIYLP